jgi:hypothetical protein
LFDYKITLFDRIEEAAMPAQLVVIPRQAGKNGDKKSDRKAEEDKEKKASEPEGSGGGSGTSDDPYGPYWPPSIGVLWVYGQGPWDIGHFASVAKLLDSEHFYRGLPGGSNTVFASVDHLDDMRFLDDVKSRLGKLPDELTIIVHEGKRRA